MKKIIAEFKEFISKGNVLDMAVGLIVGSAFTAVVTALVSFCGASSAALTSGGNRTPAFWTSISSTAPFNSAPWWKRW